MTRRYTGQTHPCHGAQPMVWGLETVWRPWRFDGRVVRWGVCYDCESDAVAAAETLGCDGRADVPPVVVLNDPPGKYEEPLQLQ